MSARPPAPARWSTRRLLGVVALVALLAALKITAPAQLALDDRLRDVVTLATSVIVESLPFVTLGIAVSVAVQLWLPRDLMFRVLPRVPWVRRAALSLLGVLLPVCECGNVPVARGLLRRGLRVPDAMTFLLAAPILNPVTIVTTYQAFGFADGILAYRVIGGFLIANLVGWLLSRHRAAETLLTPGFADACEADDGHGRGLVAAGQLLISETRAILPALIIGGAAAGIIQVGVPRDLLIGLGEQPLWSVLALMGLAFVIAICSTVDAFFVLALGSVFSPGAIVVFLVFGPMIDVKMLALLRTTFTGRALALVVTVVALASLTLGLAVNLGG